MYHFVYETTNLVNGKKYIGKHSSEDLNDDYLGSGIALKRSVTKYGKDSFKREILRQFVTSEDAFLYEAELVTQDLVNNPNYYNMILGGDGGNPYAEGHWPEEVRIKVSNGIKGFYSSCSEEKRAEHRLNQSLSKQNWSPEKRLEMSNKYKDMHATRSMEDKEKVKLKCREAALNRPKLTCPYCGKIGAQSQMKRYHFERCKHAN